MMHENIFPFQYPENVYKMYNHRMTEEHMQLQDLFDNTQKGIQYVYFMCHDKNNCMFKFLLLICVYHHYQAPVVSLQLFVGLSGSKRTIQML